MPYLALEHIAREILSGNTAARNDALIKKNAAELENRMQIQVKVIDDEEKIGEELQTTQQGKTDGSDSMNTKPGKAIPKQPIKIPPKKDDTEIDPKNKVKLGASTPIIINPSLTVGNKDRNTEGQSMDKGKKVVVKPKNEEKVTEGFLKNATINIINRAVKGVVGDPRHLKPKNIAKRAVHGVAGDLFDKPKKKRKLRYEGILDSLRGKKKIDWHKAQNQQFQGPLLQNKLGGKSPQNADAAGHKLKKEELDEAKKKKKLPDISPDNTPALGLNPFTKGTIQDEVIDEVSSEKLARYNANSRAEINGLGKGFGKPKHPLSVKKYIKRTSGIDLAVDKLTGKAKVPASEEEKPKVNKAQVVKQAHKKWKTGFVKTATEAAKSQKDRGLIDQATYDRQIKAFGIIKNGINK